MVSLTAWSTPSSSVSLVVEGAVTRDGSPRDGCSDAANDVLGRVLGLSLSLSAKPGVVCADISVVTADLPKNGVIGEVCTCTPSCAERLPMNGETPKERVAAAWEAAGAKVDGMESL